MGNLQIPNLGPFYLCLTPRCESTLRPRSVHQARSGFPWHQMCTPYRHGGSGSRGDRLRHSIPKTGRIAMFPHWLAGRDFVTGDNLLVPSLLLGEEIVTLDGER